MTVSDTQEGDINMPPNKEVALNSSRPQGRHLNTDQAIQTQPLFFLGSENHLGYKDVDNRL